MNPKIDVLLVEEIADMLSPDDVAHIEKMRTKYRAMLFYMDKRFELMTVTEHRAWALEWAHECVARLLAGDDSDFFVLEEGHLSAAAGCKRAPAETAKSLADLHAECDRQPMPSQPALPGNDR